VIITSAKYFGLLWNGTVQGQNEFEIWCLRKSEKFNLSF